MRAGLAFGMWYNEALTSLDRSRACLGSAMQVLCRHVKAWSMAVADSKLARTYAQLALGSRIRQDRRRAALALEIWRVHVWELTEAVAAAVSRSRRCLTWHFFCWWRAEWVDCITATKVLAHLISFASRFHRRHQEEQALARWRSVSRRAERIRGLLATRMTRRGHVQRRGCR